MFRIRLAAILTIPLAGLVAVAVGSASSAAATPHAAIPVPGHPSAASQLHRTSTFNYQNDFSAGNWRDPSSGGLGTTILSSTFSGSNAEDWSLQANGTCGGTVTSTCPGGVWSQAGAGGLRGFDIVTLRNIGQGSLCYGSDASTGWESQMATCDGVNGAHHYDTLFAWDPSAVCGTTSDTAFYSYQWNKNGNSDLAIIVDAGIGFSPFVSDTTPHCLQGLWTPLSS